MSSRSLEVTGSENSPSVSVASKRRLSVREEQAKAELLTISVAIRTSASNNVENWKNLSWAERLRLTKKYEDPEYSEPTPEKDTDACANGEGESRFRAIRREFIQKEDLLSYCRSPDGVDDVKVDDVVSGSLKFIDASGTEWADGKIYEFEYPVTLEFQVKVHKRRSAPVVEEQSYSKTPIDEAYEPREGDTVLIVEGEHEGRTGVIGEEWIYQDQPSSRWWVKVDGEASKIIHRSALRKASATHELSERMKSTDFPTASTCAPSDQDSIALREEEQGDESPRTSSRCNLWGSLFHCSHCVYAS